MASDKETINAKPVPENAPATFEVGRAFFEGLESYSTELILQSIRASNIDRLDLMEEKDKLYGGSWQSDGIMGAWFNVKRKLDRLQEMGKQGFLFNFNPENAAVINDTMTDLINYLSMFNELIVLKATEQCAEDFVAKWYESIDQNKEK